MTMVMKGADVAAAMKEKMMAEIVELGGNGIVPCLAIVRAGARPADLAYERGALKKLGGLGIDCNVFEFDEKINRQEFMKEFALIDKNPQIHGILLFRPLPAHLDEEAVKGAISPGKDIDCMSPVNMAKLFSGDATGFAPCTPEAVMEVLDHYKMELQGRKVVVIGRSMVVGKPLSMMLLKRDATVTICHTRTIDLEATCRNADIVIAAAGKAKMVTTGFVGRNAVVVDVGINVDGNGGICGDVDYDSVASVAGYITPVPGGVGTVTSSVLAKHVIKAAKINRMY